MLSAEVLVTGRIHVCWRSLIHVSYICMSDRASPISVGMEPERLEPAASSVVKFTNENSSGNSWPETCVLLKTKVLNPLQFLIVGLHVPRALVPEMSLEISPDVENEMTHTNGES